VYQVGINKGIIGIINSSTWFHLVGYFYMI